MKKMKKTQVRILGWAIVATSVWAGLLMSAAVERSIEIQKLALSGEPSKVGHLPGIPYSPIDNAAPLYTAAGAIANRSYQGQSGLELQKRALQLLRDARTLKRCAFPPDRDGYNYPNLVGCKKLLALASQAMTCQIQAGNLSEATELGRDSIALLRRLVQVRTTPGHLFVVEMAGELDGTLSNLGLKSILRAELEALAADLEVDLARSLDEDRVLAIQGFEEFRRELPLFGAPYSRRELYVAEVQYLRAVAVLKDAHRNEDRKTAENVAQEVSGNIYSRGLEQWHLVWEKSTETTAQLRD